MDKDLRVIKILVVILFILGLLCIFAVSLLRTSLGWW